MLLSMDKSPVRLRQEPILKDFSFGLEEGQLSLSSRPQRASAKDHLMRAIMGLTTLCRGHRLSTGQKNINGEPNLSKEYTQGPSPCYGPRLYVRRDAAFPAELTVRENLMLGTCARPDGNRRFRKSAAVSPLPEAPPS